MKNEMHRLACKLRVNHSWLYIGIETFVVGCYFTATPGMVTGFTPFHVPVNFLDHWILAILWIVLGILIIVNNLFDVIPDFRRIYSYAALALWSFYASVMIMRDLNSPEPPAISLLSLIFLVVTLRILTLLLLSEPRAKKGGGHHG